MTVLHLAAERGHEVVVWLLLENGVNVDVICEGLGMEAVVRSLIKNGANYEVRSERWKGTKALHLATRKGPRLWCGSYWRKMLMML